MKFNMEDIAQRNGFSPSLGPWVGQRSAEALVSLAEDMNRQWVESNNQLNKTLDMLKTGLEQKQRAKLDPTGCPTYEPDGRLAWKC